MISQLHYTTNTMSTDPFDDLWFETRGKELRDSNPDYEEDNDDENEED